MLCTFHIFYNCSKIVYLHYSLHFIFHYLPSYSISLSHHLNLTTKKLWSCVEQEFTCKIQFILTIHAALGPYWWSTESKKYAYFCNLGMGILNFFDVIKSWSISARLWLQGLIWSLRSPDQPLPNFSKPSVIILCPW